MTVPLHSCWREWPDVSPAETLNIASCFDMLLANLKPARCVLGCFDALHGLLTVQPPPTTPSAQGMRGCLHQPPRTATFVSQLEREKQRPSTHFGPFTVLFRIYVRITVDIATQTKKQPNILKREAATHTGVAGPLRIGPTPNPHPNTLPLSKGGRLSNILRQP